VSFDWRQQLVRLLTIQYFLICERGSEVANKVTKGGYSRSEKMESFLKGVLGACVIAFVSASPNTSEAFLDNAGKNGSQVTHVHSMAIGAIQVKQRGNDSIDTDLENTVFGISCGLLGVFLLRMANKR
jgi:hypothetical protein